MGRGGVLTETFCEVYLEVNTELDPLSYLLSCIDIKPKHIPKMIPQPIPLRLDVGSMMIKMLICRLQTSHQHKKIWLIITVMNVSREIYVLDEVLCHSKLLTKQTWIINGMGMMKPLGVMGIEVTTFHDIGRGL